MQNQVLILMDDWTYQMGILLVWYINSWWWKMKKNSFSKKLIRYIIIHINILIFEKKLLDSLLKYQWVMYLHLQKILITTIHNHLKQGNRYRWPHIALGRPVFGQRPQRGQSPVEHRGTFVRPARRSEWDAIEGWLKAFQSLNRGLRGLMLSLIMPIGSLRELD